MSYYKIGNSMDVRVIGPGRIRVGADPVPLTQLESVRVEAKLAAASPLNKKKKFFGYGRLVPQADIAPEDQILTKNSDSLDDMVAWVTKASGDPQMVWAGFWDNATQQLVQSSVGEAIVVAPDKPTPAPQKHSNMGLVLGIAAAGMAGMVAFSPKKRKPL